MSELEQFSWAPAEPQWHKCPRCGSETLAAECGCVAREERMRLREERRKQDELDLTRGFLPLSFRWVFDSPELIAKRTGLADPEKTLDPARSAKWVVFQGPAGAGKTTAAAAMVAPTLEPFSSLLWADSYQLARAQQHHPLGQGEAPLIRQAKRVRLLVLDDLGAEPKGVNSCVPDIVYERHAEELSTIITTGFNAKQIADMYGDGIARRVFERAHLIRLGGKAAG